MIKNVTPIPLGGGRGVFLKRGAVQEGWSEASGVTALPEGKRVYIIPK